MCTAELTRNTIAFYLSTIDLFTAPLRAFVQSQAVCAEEQIALQQEVWELWAEQPAPVSELIFS